MKHTIKMAVLFVALFITSLALARDNGPFNVAITPRSCVIQTDTTFMKRAFCSAVMSAGTRTYSGYKQGDHVTINGWNPSQFRYNGFGYEGTGQGIGGVRIESLFVPVFDTLTEDVYWAGSGQPDIAVHYTTHTW